MSQQKPSPPPRLNSSLQQRPRSNSVIKLKSSQNSPTQSPTTSSTTSSKQPNSNNSSTNNQFKRSMSVSEGLHVRLPTLHHSETEPFPYSPVSQHSTTNNICPSESNWANKYDDFDIGKPIGYGSSAVVYEAIYKPLKMRVAIKMIDLDMFERNQIDELRRETALMALSKHPNVLRVYGSFVNGSKLYIVTPYLAAGSCLDIMKSSFPDGFEEISIATTLRQALEGLIYLHKNGHIHRDVKAGNLLMDQQGTVLLADFGVSSSLAENGDVRKTFVGTPCWMAPEVMEQAGYDYKADIWSFGITALELATGHAPFAKFPPMKVLMMTLSNAPPTLDREGGKHKYSKAFKDMIDMCLQKDPSKRPSAEKLLLHPFFKQAKKRDYLVKSVLSSVLPLDKRPHRKIPQKHISFESTEQWDFDDDENNTLSDDDNHTTAAAEKPVNTATSASGTSTPQQQVQFQQQNVNENINTPAEAAVPTTVPLERSRSVVQFEDYIKANHLDRSKSTSSPSTHHHSSTDNNTSELPPIKKHISFGEVVIKDPPVVRSIMSPVTESPAPIMASSNESNTSLNYAPPTLSSAPTSKKSRFVIEDSAPTSQTSSNNSPAPAYDNVSSPPSGTPPISASEMASAGIGLGISAAPSNTSITNINTVSVINNSTPSSAAAAANITSNNNTLQEGEFKKGRFSVNQTPARPATPSDDAQQIVNGAPTTAANNEKSSYQQQQGDSKPTPMARAASQDSFSERKSRFEVKHSNNNNSNSALMATPISVASTPIEPGTPLHSLPLSRENSNTSALSRDSSVNAKVSRFSVEKPEAVGPYCELPTSASTAVPATAAAATAMSPECRKKGRFELTGGSDTNREFINHLESPQSTVGPSPVISPSNSLSRGQAHRILDPSMPHMVYSHMESLLKQTEIQKNMLHDLLATMPLLYNNGNNTIQQQQHIVPTRTRTISDSKKPSSSSSIAHNEEFYQRAPTSNPSNITVAPLLSLSSSTSSVTTAILPTSSQPTTLSTDISSTVEHLQQLLSNSSKERERLIRENEALKREVDRLKRNQQQQQGILLKKQPSLEPMVASTTASSSSAVAQEAVNNNTTSPSAATNQQ